MFRKIEFGEGRVFVVGDIHGEFDLLEKGLRNLGFHYARDNLLSVGDLVDRGPKSHLAVDYLREPWFHAVRGNHEQMTIDAGGTYWHCQNGGEWFAKLSVEDKRKTVTAFNALPLAIEALCPSGRRVGVCHASFPATRRVDNVFLTDWNDVEQAMKISTYCADVDVLWDREQIGRAKKHFRRLHKVSENALREFHVEGIDHVYFGHTPLKETLTIGNCTWLDTGAFATGNLTILEVDNES